MTFCGRRLFVALSLVLAATLACASIIAPASPARAQGLFSEPKYAAIVVDANTGEVLYAKRADAIRHPASLTKIMTLYLTFEALATGRLSTSDVITISPHAYSMMPSKVSTHPGETLTVAEAIPAMTVHSANDVAVALAERLGGSEAHFAQLMTLRAQELGMSNTRFVNASGLPPDELQISTARDMAILSRAIMRDYPQYYHYFGLMSFDFHGKLLMNHNHLVGRMPGVDGMKTGYTSLAGFNLVASGVREGHRLITVVLGGPSVAARDENVEELLNAGFTVLAERASEPHLSLASIVGDAGDDMTGPIERAPIDEGSADQPGVKVVVQPQVRTLPVMDAARELSPKLTERRPPEAAVALAEPPTTEEAVTPCAPLRRRHGRRHIQASRCGPVAIAAADRRRAAPVSDDSAVAEATPCAPHGRRHRHAACAAAAPAPEVAVARESGPFMIQVGAYKNQGQAQDHLDQVAGGFGRVVGGASARVEKAGGNYRVRFRGLSAQQARAACHALSARGQPCMVMGAS